MVCFNQTKSGGERSVLTVCHCTWKAAAALDGKWSKLRIFCTVSSSLQGEVPGTKLLMLPGPTTLYWFGSTLLEAGPPPFPVDSLELDPVMVIPRSAVESVPGIRYLLDT